MKQISFKKLRIRNFLSFGNDPIEFEIKPGLSFITGYNKDKDSKNGVGKSTLMVESLSFLLFGATYRDINQKAIINNKTNKTCIVEGWLTVNDDSYEIIRSLSPNKLILKKNGLDISRTIPETNKDIIDILGMPKEIYTNTIVMNNKDSNAFLAQATAFKSKFIEGILGLEVFTKMFEACKADVNENAKKVLAGQMRVKDQKASLESDKQYQAAENKKWEDNINWFKNQIRELKFVQPVDNTDSILRIDNAIRTFEQASAELVIEQKTVSEKLATEKDILRKRIDTLKENFKPKEEKYSKINIKCIQLEGNIKTETNNLKSFKSVQKECPTCKRAFDNCNSDDIEHTKEDISIKIKDLANQVTKLKQGLQKIDEDRKANNTEISSNEEAIRFADSTIQNYLTNAQVYKDNIADLLNEKTKLLEAQSVFQKSQDKINNLEEQLANAQEWENPFDAKVLSAENKLSILQTELGILEARQIILEAKKFATSPSGIKTLAVKKIIQTLNNRLNFYLEKLNSPVRCEFDEFFTEKFETLDGKEFQYGNLSGGEAKRIDFAILFTFRDIRRLQSNVFVNISVFDEIFDSALDESAMSTIITLLKETVEKTQEAFYIISHRSENVEVEGCEVINLMKENGITKII